MQVLVPAMCSKYGVGVSQVSVGGVEVLGSSAAGVLLGVCAGGGA